MPCQNGGICHDMINSFRCSCPKGTAGMLCEINEPDCFDSACHHGGTCVDKVRRVFFINIFTVIFNDSLLPCLCCLL